MDETGFTAAEVRAAEAPLLAAGEPLMARAAAGLARAIRPLLSRRDGIVVLLVGSGNNGGDALFAGAELAATGADVRIVPLGSRLHAAGLQAALRAGARRVVPEPAEVLPLVARADVVVDGILGTGAAASPALRDPARRIVAALLAAPLPPVVAVDLPSGISPDDGSVPDGVVLPADVTVTFGGSKRGLLLEPARRYAGRVELVEIGIESSLERIRAERSGPRERSA